jgi:hypothetical protein
LRTQESQWKFKDTDLENLRNAQKNHWAVEVKELDNLRGEKAQWDTDAAELQRLRIEKRNWDNASAELQQLRVENRNWENDCVELSQLRIDKSAWSSDLTELNRLRNDKSQWDNDVAELNQLRLASTDWSSDLIELQQLRESKIELEQQRESDQRALDEFRHDEQQWLLGQADLCNLKIERSQWQKQQKTLERQVKIARAQASLAIEQRTNKSMADAAWITRQHAQVQELQQGYQSLSTSLVHIAASAWHTQQHNRQMRTSLKALRIDLATAKREKGLELGLRLSLETKVQSLRVIGILVLAAMRSVRVRIVQVDALRLQHQMTAQRMRVANAFLLASFRGVLLEFSRSKMQCLHYKRLVICAQILGHLELRSLRSLRAKFAAVEGEKAAEVQRRTSSDANVNVLRASCKFLFKSARKMRDERDKEKVNVIVLHAMCRFLFDSKRTMRAECELVNAQLHDETALHMACQRVELNTRLAVYIFYGLLRAAIQTLGLEIDHRKRLEGYLLVTRFGILQLCLTLRTCRHLILKRNAQLKLVRSSNLELTAQLESAHESSNMQKDQIGNLRRYNETQEHRKAQALVLYNRLEKAVSQGNKLIDERKALRQAIALSFKRESAMEAKLIGQAKKEKQLVMEHDRRVQCLERLVPLLQKVLDAGSHNGRTHVLATVITFFSGLRK